MNEKDIKEYTKVEEQDTAFDVYSVIRSTEIREYFRKECNLEIFDKEQIILQSYISVQQKAEMLKRLAQTGNEEENRKVDEMYHLYMRYMDVIFQSAVRTIYILECVEQWWEEGHIECDFHAAGVFDTVDEIAEEMARIYDGEEAKCYGNVTVVQVPQEARVNEICLFKLYWIDGKWEIKDLRINNASLKEEGFSEDTYARFWDKSSYHPLPFKDGDRVKFQLPFMKEPYYGELCSEKDSEGRWHHWLNEDINLTHIGFAEYNGYSTLDWIKRA